MLELHTTHLAGHAVVRATGTLRPDDVGTIRTYLARRIDAGDLSLVLDLHTVHDAPAECADVIASAVREAQATGGAVVVVAREDMRQALAVGLPQLPTAESLDAALGDLAPPLDADRGHLRPNDPVHPQVAFGA